MTAGTPGAGPGVQWLLRRDCSITPQQLAAVYASVCTLSLLISGVFYWNGAPLVAALAGIELLALGVAMLVFARHAADREVITLVGRSVLVERNIGNRIERTDLAADGLAVEPAAAQGSLIELRGRGRKVRVGRFLRPELRGAFAQELRQALRQAFAGPEHKNDSN